MLAVSDRVEIADARQHDDFSDIEQEIVAGCHGIEQNV
jgi:hypothetical protein